MQMKLTNFCFFLVVPVAVGCGTYRSTLQKQRTEHLLESALAQCTSTVNKQNTSITLSYQSCEQINEQWRIANEYDGCVRRAYEDDHNRKYNHNPTQPNSEAVAASTDASKSAKSSGGADSLTNVRHSGVDEGDFVKVSAQQIFVTGREGINVIDRASKQSLGTLTLAEQSAHSQFLNKQEGINLLVHQDKLIAISDNVIRIYEIVADSLPRLRQQRELTGAIVETRLLNDKITLITQSFLKTEALHTEMPSRPTKLVLDNENCSSFYPPQNPLSLSTMVTRVESFPVHNIAESKSMSFLGDSKLYMTDKNIYLYQNSSSSPWERRFRNRTSSSDISQLRKISLNSDGSLGRPVSGEVKGRIKDVWALSELTTGELAVATTTGKISDDSARNHFSVLAEKEGQLRTIGETPEYGEKEDIRSVRFVGNTAYVVTFKKTDPLYAIDTSDPSSPKILGELKIPGFSTYMHPLNQNHLIGLGFDAVDQGTFAYYQGLQLSLFDVSNPKEMIRSAVKIFGTRGSSSLATTDHKAFFVDASQAVVGFPVQLVFSCNTFDPGCAQKSNLLPPASRQKPGISGAALVKIEGSGFGKEQFISNADLLPPNCFQNSTHSWWESPAQTMDVQRILKIDGDLISISRFGLKVFRWGEHVETLHSVRWKNKCQD